MTIKIDFYGSTHGHFLEYVSNVYIMQTTPSKTSIFKPPTFSAHNADHNYLEDRVIECGHFSSKNNIAIDDIVIRISVPDNDNMFFVAITNLIYKAGDIGFEKQLLEIPESVRIDPVQHRENWYSKFAEKKLYADFYHNFQCISNPVFEFPFESFFCFKDFCIALNKLATFLNQTFFPDQSLWKLWSEFIQHNQGWQSYINCNDILEKCFSNQDRQIDCTVIEQGWINYNLSKMCRLYQGPLFNEVVYPSSTDHMQQLIKQHLIALAHVE